MNISGTTKLGTCIKCGQWVYMEYEGLEINNRIIYQFCSNGGDCEIDESKHPLVTTLNLAGAHI